MSMGKRPLDRNTIAVTIPVPDSPGKYSKRVENDVTNRSDLPIVKV